MQVTQPPKFKSFEEASHASFCKLFRKMINRLTPHDSHVTAYYLHNAFRGN